MQKTRESIIHILKTRGQASVDDLSAELGLTSVTVRHHLEILRGEGLVAEPEPLRREGPGRPQYLYRLTDAADSLFPSNYDLIAAELIREMEHALPPEEIELVIQRIAQRIASRAELPAGADLPTRVEAAVRFLNELGYMAVSEEDEQGRMLLHIRNCPYERLARKKHTPCVMDGFLLGELLDPSIVRSAEIIAGDRQCTYILPAAEG